MDAGNRGGLQVEGRERLAEDGLDPADRFGLEPIGDQPDAIAFELGQIAAETEFAQTAAGELEQLITRSGSRDAAAQRRERSERASRRVRVRILLWHRNRRIGCSIGGPDDKPVAGRHQWASGIWERRLRCPALRPRHRLGWRCVAVVLRQSPYRQWGTVPRRIVM